MKEYVVSFRYLGFEKQEKVTADNIFKAENLIKEKYGKDNVKLIATCSTLNQW